MNVLTDFRDFVVGGCCTVICAFAGTTIGILIVEFFR